MRAVPDLGGWTPQALDRLLDDLRSDRTARWFKRWELRRAARARKRRRGWK